MPETAFKDIEAYIAELRARALKSQDHAKSKLNPLFRKRDDRKDGPGDFIDSSYLFLRSCDADEGSRPFPCSVFWLSPDLRVAPLSNLGAPTRTLQAGASYRLTATVRNRGDLMVPSAKVEFWLVNPSLGFDVRFATKIGVAAGRVQADGATEISLDCIIAPNTSGHRCLFARVFSFAPLDIPVDDFALSPLIDRHVAQLNLDIVAQASIFRFDWIHHRNASERIEIVPMNLKTIQALRVEVITPMKLLSGAKLAEKIPKIGIQFVPADDGETAVYSERLERGLQLFSNNRKATSVERQADLTKQVQEAISALETKPNNSREFRKLFAAYRKMTAQSHRTQVDLMLPDFGLTKNQAVPLQILRFDTATNNILGGIALVVTAQ